MLHIFVDFMFTLTLIFMTFWFWFGFPGLSQCVGCTFSEKSNSIDTFWERMFRPTLGSLITEGTGWVPSSYVLLELHVSGHSPRPDVLWPFVVCLQAKIYVQIGELHAETDSCIVVVTQSCNSCTVWYCPDCNKEDEGTTDEFSYYHFRQQQASGHSHVSTLFPPSLCYTFSFCWTFLCKMKQTCCWDCFDWALSLQLKGCSDESCCSRSASSNDKRGQGMFLLQNLWTWCTCGSEPVVVKSLAWGIWDWVQVMTPKPECVGLDTTLVDALHTMHDGKFLHLPVVNQGNALVLPLYYVWLYDDTCGLWLLGWLFCRWVHSGMCWCVAAHTWGCSNSEYILLNSFLHFK